MSVRFRDYLNEQLKDDRFRAEYEALELQELLAQSIIAARKEKGFTREQLSAKTGLTLSQISKIENGNINTSLRNIQKLASGLGLRLSFALQ